MQNNLTSPPPGNLAKTEKRLKTPLVTGFLWQYYGVSHGKLGSQVIKGSI